MSWVNDCDAKIITIVTTRAEKNLITDYPDVFFTSDQENNIQSAFPTVFLDFTPSKEMGQDLENSTINAMYFAYTIDVTVSQEQGLESGKEVIWEIIDQFKKLSFNIVSAPKSLPTGNSTKRIVANVGRLVGANDGIG